MAVPDDSRERVRSFMIAGKAYLEKRKKAGGAVSYLIREDRVDGQPIVMNHAEAVGLHALFGDLIAADVEPTA